MLNEIRHDIILFNLYVESKIKIKLQRKLGMGTSKREIWRVSKMDKEYQEVQISSYKINQGDNNVQHKDCNQQSFQV